MFFFPIMLNTIAELGLEVETKMSVYSIETRKCFYEENLK
jgi:hypothetical protein